MNAPTKAQIINGTDGLPAFAVIPYSDYIANFPQSTLIPHAVVEMVVMEEMTMAAAWRRHLGLTQADVAERIGISQSAYAQQESALKPRKATREKIAAALGITAEQLEDA